MTAAIERELTETFRAATARTVLHQNSLAQTLS